MSKKNHHEEHMDESWLIPYADLLTLLLALFIVLFASSQIDSVKFGEMKAAFIDSFKTGVAGLSGDGSYGGYGGYSGNGGEYVPGEGGGTDGTNPSSTGTAEPSVTPGGSGNGNGNGNGNAVAGYAVNARLAELQDKFSKFINSHNLGGEIQTAVGDQMIMVIISDVVVFDPGSAAIKKDFYTTIHEIGNILAGIPGLEVQILGHTDNVPIHNGRYDSNWDLSADRALNFMKILLEDTRLNPADFAAIGYGEYRPVATNDTVEGRLENRRVEVTVRYKEPKPG